MTAPLSKLEQTVGGLRCTSVSDVGMRRKSNQDSVAIALADSPAQWASHGHLFVVADGMGAHAAGELASKLATDNIPHSYFKRTEHSPSEAIADAVREANDKIHTKGEDSVDFHGMGTTCSCLVLLPQGALAAHVGDSRVYRLRENQFEQLTFDHSLVWEMAAASNAAEEDLPAYVPKNVITRSLGPHPTVAVDVEGPFALQSGDRFLLCSDGLTGPLSPELIGMVLLSLPSLEVAQSLVDLANLRGGPDNITVIVAEVFDVGELGETMASDVSEEFVSSTRSKNSGTGPYFWSAMASCSVLAVASAAMGHPWVAWISAGIGLCLGAVGFFLKSSQSRPCVSNHSSFGPRGKAPYRCHECAPSAANIASLGDIVRQLEELESRREWDFDWEPIHEDRLKALDAVSRGSYQEAVVGYCSAVRRLMKALRESSPEKSGDSSIEL